MNVKQAIETQFRGEISLHTGRGWPTVAAGAAIERAFEDCPRDEQRPCGGGTHAPVADGCGEAPGIVAPGQRVRYRAPKLATGVYDVLAVRDGRASLRGVQGTQWQGDHWSARIEELELVKSASWTGPGGRRLDR